MKTIYIDVYFLINFTVDLLALYFSAFFMKIKASNIRLVLGSCVGGLYAVFGVLFIESPWIMYPLSIVLLIIMCLVAVGGIGFLRFLKYGVSFFLFQTVIGGLVYGGYCALNSMLGDFKLDDVGGENKNLLLLSLLVLLSIGVLKIIISLLGNVRSEKSVRVIIKYKESEECFDAFVDSGNLARDPIDKTPVMLLNEKVFFKIFDIDLRDADKLLTDVKKRIRIIPVSFGGVNKILYAIRADRVYCEVKNKREELNLLVACDDSGTFNGYCALIPLVAMEDINYGKN